MQIIETRVNKVKIFKSGCTVERFGTVSLVEGKNRVLIGGLTVSALPDTLSLRFPDMVSAENIQVLSARDVLEEKPSAALEDELGLVQQQIDAANIQLKLLKENGDFHGASQVEPDKILAYLDVLPERLGSVSATLQSLGKKRIEITKKLNEQQAKEALPVISLDVLSSRAMDCPFFLQYQENAAGWEPQYEVHFTDRDQPLTVRMRAKIVQTTGENWENVETSLNTGNPFISLNIPTLRPAWLNFRVVPVPQPVMYAAAAPASGGRSARASAKTASLEDTADFAPMMEEMNFARVETPLGVAESQETQTSWQLPGGRDISDGALGNMADLQNFIIPGTYRLTAVPMLDSSVWFTAEVATKEWNLPAASMAVYVRDTYIGKTYISPDKTKETFLLPLGRDERFTVTREQSIDSGSSALIRNVQSRKLSYRIRIAGNVTEFETIQVKDRIPVSRNEKITVTPEELSGASVNQETGELTWITELVPEQPLELALSYTVTWPKDQEIDWSGTTASFQRPSGGSSGGWFCPECGARNAAGIRFCTTCGRPR